MLLSSGRPLRSLGHFIGSFLGLFLCGDRRAGRCHRPRMRDPSVWATPTTTQGRRLFDLADATTQPVDFITPGLFPGMQVQLSEVSERHFSSPTSFQFGSSVHRGRILSRTTKADEGILPMPPMIPHLVTKVWASDGIGGNV